MSVIPQIPNSYLEALAAGLLYGLVFCTSLCLPYITSYIAGIGASFRKGVIVTLFYTSGSLTTYALIGAVVGIFIMIGAGVLTILGISTLIKALILTQS